MSQPTLTLTQDQQNVLTLLSEGHTATAAAANAGVHRNTVRNWQLTNPEFAQAAEAAAARNPSTQLAARATALLEAALDDPATPQAQKLRIALAIVKISPLASFRTPADSASPTHKMHNAPTPKPAPPLPEPLEIPLQRTMHNPIRAAITPARNSPCPCNSGLKFKRCCAQKSVTQKSLS